MGQAISGSVLWKNLVQKKSTTRFVYKLIVFEVQLKKMLIVDQFFLKMLRGKRLNPIKVKFNGKKNNKGILSLQVKYKYQTDFSNKLWNSTL